MSHTSYGTFTNGPGQPATSIKDMQAAVDKLRGLPPENWLLMSPDGRVWADPNPAALLKVLLLHNAVGDLT